MTTFPGESAEYRAARDLLVEKEIELRRLTEAVAAARRALPPGGQVPEDYVFEGADGAVHLSELFSPGKDTLAVYHMMFPRSIDEMLPCPSCTSFLDAFDGAARHVTQRVNLVVVAKAPMPDLLAHAERRGWRHLRLLSAAGTTFNRAYLAEDEDGSQLPLLNVFRRDGAVIRHFWGSELMFAAPDPGQDPRHTDTIDPQWNLFDYTPDGRGTDWDPKLDY
jgi:predicted dithiol-disulfide oxidoreductase (DUF899 family)